MTGKGYRVALQGPASLLGRQLAQTIEERNFPVVQLIELGALDDEPDLPVIDLQERGSEWEASETAQGCEFTLVASIPSGKDWTALRTMWGRGPAEEESGFVIVACDPPAGAPPGELRIPFMDRTAPDDSGQAVRGYFVSPHPATILLGAILLPLSSRFTVRSAVANLFVPASSLGARGVEELQNQTIKLLSFQKFPKAVFDAQLAFNMLPRLGDEAQPKLAAAQARIQQELERLLGEDAPAPAIRVLPSPVFHSMVLSLYVEFEEPAALPELTKALAQPRVEIREWPDPGASPVEASGTNNILVDDPVADAAHETGVWIWAAVDDIQLAADNVLDIAGQLQEELDD
jgi:aspartate-semialdehyde dehydrogenase